MIARSGHRVDIEKATASRSEMGGEEQSWAVVMDDLPAWVQPASSRVTLQYAAMDLTVTHVVYLAEDPEIEAGSKYRVQWNGTGYLVQSAENQAGLGRIWRLEVG